MGESFSGRRKLGLALGGGGARGLAHIGVLKVLEREGIEVSCLAGASIGALIAALAAAGWPAEEIEREALRMYRKSNLVRLINLTAPRRGLLEGSRVRLYLEGLFGRREFARTGNFAFDHIFWHGIPFVE